MLDSLYATFFNLFVPDSWRFGTTLLFDRIIAAGYIAVGLLFLATPVVGLGILLVGGLISGSYTYTRRREILDTPSARIHSAAQGYVELVGRCGLPNGIEPVGFGPLPPCVWYRVRVIARDRNLDGYRAYGSRYRQEQVPLLLKDGDQECIVDWQEADLRTSKVHDWREGRTRYRAWYIEVNDPLYATGQFITIVGENRLSTDRVVDKWQHDPLKYRARLDRDGSVDAGERRAVLEAEDQEDERRLVPHRPGPPRHVMLAPADGRPYVITNDDPEKMVTAYRRLGLLHFVVAGVALVLGVAMHAAEILSFDVG